MTDLMESARDLVSEYVDLGESDTSVIAEKVVGEADALEIRALAVAHCVSLAHGVINSRRTSTAREFRSATEGNLRSGSGRVSGKLAAADSVWDRYMSEQLRTESGFKRIAECTAEDFRWAAGVRRAQVEGLVREIEGLERLAEAIEANGAECAGDLPPGCVVV